MAWWSWMLLGLLLLGSELLVVDAAFFLVFIGFAALVMGTLSLFGLALDPSMQWLLFSVLALVSMVLFRKRLYQKLRGSTPDYGDGLAGERIVIDTALDPGQTSRQHFRGTQWTIVNRGAARVEQNTEVTIDSTEGLTIVIKPGAGQA
jgi:membrane protein implicated in regulation of membrane protease activity